MKKNLLFIFSMFFCVTLLAQIKIENFDSRILNSTRNIKIKLPNNYNSEDNLKHPIVIVLDGDYLFNPVVGQTDFQTYFDDMPGSIIVGVMHDNYRFNDTYHDEVSGLPINLGADFYEFIGKELIPYIDGNYNTSKFRIVVGHDLTANFMTSFLLKDQPLFQAFVNISPDFVGDMSENIVNRMEWLKEDTIFYMATSSDDDKSIKKNVLQVNAEINKIENEHLSYYFDEFEEASHFSLATRGIARAFEKMFNIYGPITDEEIDDKVIGYEGTLDIYIIDRCKRIQNLFGIDKKISVEEFQKIADAAIQREDFKSLEKLGRLANNINPTGNLGTYYLALYAEKEGKSKRAMKLYETALELDDSIIIDRDLILSRVKDLKTLVGSND